jgi:hypothetical protein
MLSLVKRIYCFRLVRVQGIDGARLFEGLPDGIRQWCFEKTCNWLTTSVRNEFHLPSRAWISSTTVFEIIWPLYQPMVCISSSTSMMLGRSSGEGTSFGSPSVLFQFGLTGTCSRPAAWSSTTGSSVSGVASKSLKRSVPG